MTHQYTKLADALELKGQSYQELKDREDACREAARILRAADAVDVQGFMALVRKATSAYYQLGLASGEWRCEPQHHADKDAADAALESALRLALAASPEDQIIELAQALEQRRALAITDAVHNLPIGGRTANMPTAFQAGYCAACEEIEHRLRTEEWTHCLKPVGAVAPKGTPLLTSGVCYEQL